METTLSALHVKEFSYNFHMFQLYLTYFNHFFAKGKLSLGNKVSMPGISLESILETKNGYFNDTFKNNLMD